MLYGHKIHKYTNTQIHKYTNTNAQIPVSVNGSYFYFNGARTNTAWAVAVAALEYNQNFAGKSKFRWKIKEL